MTGVPRYSPSPGSTGSEKHKGLSIEVPPNDSASSRSDDNPESPMQLDDPLVLTNKLFSPSQANFDSLTQLPTPIINSGSFGGFSPVDSHPNIEVPKTRKKAPFVKLNYTDTESIGSGDGLNRTISEYRPTNRKQFIENQQSKRIISNPIIDKTKIPSPPGDETSHLESQFREQTFYSSKFDRTFKFVKIIGRGNFSNVILVEDITDSKVKVAIKVIHIPMKNKNQIKNFTYFLKRELNILYQLNHANIIRLLDYDINIPINKGEIESENNVESESEYDHEQLDQDAQDATTNLSNQLIYLNYCPGGNLYDFMVENHHKYGYDANYWVIIRNIVKELISSIIHLHEQNIIHRDIKLENVLLNYSVDELLTQPSKPSITCLTDFGLAKRLSSPDQLLSTRCGSQDYIPPEILMGLKYDGKLTDSWSIGVLIYCLLENRLPFDLPPMNYLTQSGISPSVIKRKLNKNTPAHRIAMIDWDWYSINDFLNNRLIDNDTKQIIHSLQAIVEKLLARKEKRILVTDLVTLPEFSWIL